MTAKMGKLENIAYAGELTSHHSQGDGDQQDFVVVADIAIDVWMMRFENIFLKMRKKIQLWESDCTLKRKNR